MIEGVSGTGRAESRAKPHVLLFLQIVVVVSCVCIRKKATLLLVLCMIQVVIDTLAGTDNKCIDFCP